MCNQSIPFFAGTSDIEPPIPQDADLRSVRWYKLDILSLLNSDFIHMASNEEFGAAVKVWTKSIHQVPAGSLPNDEAILAKLAGGYDHRRKPWKRIRDMVLHGWDLCSDGRLYHQAVAGTVLDILASARAPAVSAPQSARDITREKNAERQRRFKEKQRNLRLRETATASQVDEVVPASAAALTVTPEPQVTLPVTLPVTPVTLPIKEEDKDKDKVTLPVTLPVTPEVTPPVTPKEPLPEAGDTLIPTREGTLCKQLRALGVRATPHMVVVREMCSRHSDEHILAAAEIALEKKGSGIHVGYIAAMLKDSGPARKGANNKPPAGPPNRELIPPVAVGSPHFIKL